MILIDKKTSETATLYISKDEAKKLGIEWVEENKNYKITNQQEKIKRFSEVDKKLNFKNFAYDVFKTTEEEKKIIKDKGINKEMPFAILVKKNNKADPILQYLDMLEREAKE